MREVLALILIAGAGWWLYTNRAQVMGLADELRGALDPAPSGAIDTIPDTTARALAYAAQAGVPLRDRSLVAAVIEVESSANPLAHNTDGEDSRGLMQVQISTAQGLWDADNGVLGIRRRFERDELGRVLFDPVAGVVIGYAFIRYLRDRVPASHGTSPQDWVIRAYNGGEFWHLKGTGVRGATLGYLQKVRAAQAAQQGEVA